MVLGFYFREKLCGFLVDAPEICFFTCYDLLLHRKDGFIHHLEDYDEISKLADIITGDDILELVLGYMFNELKDCSYSTLHSSLSTSLALQHEIGNNVVKSGGITTLPAFYISESVKVAISYRDRELTHISDA
ncbi:hypothetical protein CQW23_23939 [Capsicum baccatum]|uniref:Uncharacterized protein n=1 Tax=Capsicum baccatum TaxID=33114 RepID=A0A2G2VTB9_CAPBA|nr:hypothetical protein CQW23_23939 [Capsicum baccatum]